MAGARAYVCAPVLSMPGARVTVCAPELSVAGMRVNKRVKHVQPLTIQALGLYMKNFLWGRLFLACRMLENKSRRMNK